MQIFSREEETSPRVPEVYSQTRDDLNIPWCGVIYIYIYIYIHLNMIIRLNKMFMKTNYTLKKSKVHKYNRRISSEFLL